MEAAPKLPDSSTREKGIVMGVALALPANSKTIARVKRVEHANRGVP
jgi:hypothetical protein